MKKTHKIILVMFMFTFLLTDSTTNVISSGYDPDLLEIPREFVPTNPFHPRTRYLFSDGSIQLRAAVSEHDNPSLFDNTTSIYYQSLEFAFNFNQSWLTEKNIQSNMYWGIFYQYHYGSGNTYNTDSCMYFDINTNDLCVYHYDPRPDKNHRYTYRTGIPTHTTLVDVQFEIYVLQKIIGSIVTSEFFVRTKVYYNQTIVINQTTSMGWSMGTKILRVKSMLDHIPNTIDYNNRYRGLTVLNNVLTSDNLPSFEPISKGKPRMVDITFDSEEERPFWTYHSQELERAYDNPIEFNESINENKSFTFNTTFTSLAIKSIEKRYYYNPDTIEPESWGNWETLFLGQPVNWNWLRDFLVATINAIVFLFQIVMYLLTLAFNYLLVWLILAIIVVVWNYPVYWMYYGLCAALFYMFFMITYLWEYVIVPIWTWIKTNIIEPIWEYLKQVWCWLIPDGLILLIDIYLGIVSYVFAGVIWVFALGMSDYEAIHVLVHSMLRTLNHGFFDVLMIFISEVPLFLSFVGSYLMLTGLVYIKYIYSKAKGHNTRAAKLQSAINVYKLPIVLTVRLVMYIVGFIQGGAPTDGADE